MPLTSEQLHQERAGRSDAGPDPDADRVLFDTIATQFRAGADRKLLRLPHHINDEAFADALVAAWREIAPALREAQRA